MTHKPPVPEASTPPWPAQPAPIDHSEAPAPAQAEESGSIMGSKGMAVAAGVAVGSAALAAALLFAGRHSKPKSAATATKLVPKSESQPDAVD